MPADDVSLKFALMRVGIPAADADDVVSKISGGAATWGAIGGTLSAQTDLNSRFVTNEASISSNTTRLAQIGNPVAISIATTLVDTHNGENLVCTGTPQLTLNLGRVAGFGCSIKNAFTTAGTAAITDLRTTTGTAMCCLVQSDTTGAGGTYDLVGTK